MTSVRSPWPAAELLPSPSRLTSQLPAASQTRCERYAGIFGKPVCSRNRWPFSVTVDVSSIVPSEMLVTTAPCPGIWPYFFASATIAPVTLLLAASW